MSHRWGMTLLLAAVLAASPSPWTELGLPTSLQRVLDKGDFGGTPAGFRGITLSHVADGCVSLAKQKPEHTEAAKQCVARAYSQALALQPKTCPKGVCDGKQLATSADPLFLAHLLLVMGANDAMGACTDEALHVELSRELSEASVADPFAHLPSYRSLSLRWPADQSALLAGLHRADVAHGTSFHVEPTKAYFAFIDEKGTHRSGLPKSEVTGKGPGAKYPRGCAQSFISRYLAEVDAPRTLAWWKTYRSGYFVSLPLGIAGFREWPKGVDGQVDSDSGPVVFGIGTAASALAISAAKANGDAATARKLERSAETVTSLGVGGSVVHAAFAEAIRFEGRWHAVTAAE